MAWVDALALRKDEKVVDSWQGRREIIGATFDVTLEDNSRDRKRITVKDRKEGLLILTTQRLLFMEGQDDGKRLAESVKVSLIDVDKVSFEKAPLKPIEDVEGYETHVFSLKRVGRKKEFRAFKKLLEEHIQKRNEQLKKEAQKSIKFKIT
jgi:predicted HTH domain antitoxin